MLFCRQTASGGSTGSDASTPRGPWSSLIVCNNSRPERLHAVFTLWVLYLAGYLILGLLLVLLGQDLVTGFSAALACLGNIGPGLSVVGPMGNYADFPVLSKMILTVAMWVGRLEIVAVLALLHPHVWKTLQFSRVTKGATSKTYD